MLCLVQTKNQDQLLLDPDEDIRENIVYYNEEGAGTVTQFGVERNKCINYDQMKKKIVVGSLKVHFE